MSKEVTEIINTLCEKLGVAANILVPEMARYSIARLAFLTVVQTIIVIVLVIIMSKIVKMILNDKYSDMEDKAFMVFIACIIPGLVMAFLIGYAISSATDLIGWIASPTASAFKEITSMIK